MNMKVTRIALGEYQVITTAGKEFEIQDLGRTVFEDGYTDTYTPSWCLFEIVNNQRNYWNDFWTLRDAKLAIASSLS